MPDTLLAITEDECIEFSSIIDKKYKRYLKENFIEVETNYVKNQNTYVKIIIQNEEGTFYYPVEGTMSHHMYDISPSIAAKRLIDFMDIYLDKYLKDNQTLLPIDWTEFSHENQSIYLKGQILNLQLEEKADKLLEKTDNNKDEILN